MIFTSATRDGQKISWKTPEGKTKSLSHDEIPDSGFILQCEDDGRIYMVEVPGVITKEKKQ